MTVDASAPTGGTQDLYQAVQKSGGTPGLAELPLHLTFESTDKTTSTEVLGVLTYPPETVFALLASTSGWCAVLLVHPNVKGCTYEPGAGFDFLNVYVGTKHFQSLALSRRYVREFWAERREHEMVIELRPRGPDESPVGEVMRIELVALDPGRTGLRVRHRESPGRWARFAATGYFATAGRDKIGFSVRGRDREGRPLYVMGMEGAMERNAVRYWLGLETVLSRQEQLADAGFTSHYAHWFSLTERFPMQLRELKMDEYLSNKRREHAQSMRRQREIDAAHPDSAWHSR